MKIDSSLQGFSLCHDVEKTKIKFCDKKLKDRRALGSHNDGDATSVTDVWERVASIKLSATIEQVSFISGQAATRRFSLSGIVT